MGGDKNVKSFSKCQAISPQIILRPSISYFVFGISYLVDVPCKALLVVKLDLRDTKWIYEYMIYDVRFKVLPNPI